MRKVVYLLMISFVLISQCYGTTEAQEKYKNDMLKIVEKAERKYPNDYAMQRFTIENEVKAYVDLMKMKKIVQELQ